MSETRDIKLTAPEQMKDKPVSPASGSRYEDFTCTLINQVGRTIWGAHSDDKTKDAQVAAAIIGIVGAKPKDEIEGMLAAQMVAAHNAAMECYRRSMLPEQSFEGRSENLSQANKLSRTYSTMVEALQRYRGKGQQKMTVEHVHVYEGGQAIVGQISTPEGGGLITKKEGQPHAQAITHAPMPKMPRKNQKRQALPVASHE